METETKKHEWVDWGKRTFFVLGLLQAVSTVSVAYLYYQGGALQVIKPVEAIEQQCREFDKMKVAAWGEIGKLPEERRKR